MSASHTPEPWTAEEEEHGRFVDIRPPHPRRLGASVVARVPLSDGREVEGRANARLIAASPSLLEACQEMADDLRGRLDEGDTAYNPGTIRALEMIEGALAKARGTD